MSRIYVAVASFYGGKGLNDLLAALPPQLEGRSWNLLLNRQFDSYPRGFATTYNQLVNAAFIDPDASFVWLVSDDALPRPGAFATILDTMEKDTTIGAMSPTEVWPTGVAPMSVMGAYADEPGPLVEMVFPYFSCVCVARTAWERVGAMDESLGRGYCEDVDWAIRCWQAGLRILTHRGATHFHARQTTFVRLTFEGRLKDEDNGFKNGRFDGRYPWIKTESELEIMARMRAYYARFHQEHP